MNDLEYAAELIGRLPKRDRAELRRPGHCPALWKVLVRMDKAESDYHEPYEWERRWRVLLRCIARTGQGAKPLGKALAETGWSEGRLFRLLEASEEGLYDQIRFAAAYLESKDARPDWTQFHDLLIYNNERARHAIARSYYSHQPDEENNN